jgi:hypothetical protein
MSQEVTFTAARSRTQWIGEVIDLRTYHRLARTGTHYASEETAKAAAASMWRALQAQLREAAA